MNINLSLTINEVNSVLGVLGKLPYEQVVGLIDKIRGQVTEQTKPRAVPDAPKEDASA